MTKVDSKTVGNDKQYSYSSSQQIWIVRHSIYNIELLLWLLNDIVEV